MRKLYKLDIQKGTDTPWGIAQTVEEIAPGIKSISTASHGGIHLTPERRQEMPEAIRNIQTFAGGNWYEEDCDVALVVAAFPQYFDAKVVENCRNYLKAIKGLSDRSWIVPYKS